MPATPAWPPKSAPRLFIDQEVAPGSPIVVEGNQAHYLSRVMRVGSGSAVILCDNATGEWAAAVLAQDKRSVTLEPMMRLRPREEVPDFWLCAALLKKDRFDMILEKATELGVRRIVPTLTRRCVADKLNPERAQARILEAAEQCARTALPELETPQSLTDLLVDWPTDRALFFADEEGGRPAAEAFGARPGPAALLTGPEGGFATEERAAIGAMRQAIPISLGPRILRGETATLAGVALWMGIAGDWR